MGSIRFANNLNLDLNEIRNVKIHVVTTLPTPDPSWVGRIVTMNGRLYVCDGTAWALKATDSDMLGAQLPAYYLDRANQTGTQPVSTLTGLDAAITAKRLDQFAAPIGPVNLGSQKLSAVANGTVATDAVTLGQLNTKPGREAGVVPSGNVTATVTHSLATADIAVQVKEVSTGDVIHCAVTIVDANTVTLTFAVAPTASQYRYLLMG
jgi:hypothetical protein